MMQASAPLAHAPKHPKAFESQNRQHLHQGCVQNKGKKQYSHLREHASLKPSARVLYPSLRVSAPPPLTLCAGGPAN